VSVCVVAFFVPEIVTVTPSAPPPPWWETTPLTVPAGASRAVRLRLAPSSRRPEASPWTPLTVVRAVMVPARTFVNPALPLAAVRPVQDPPKGEEVVTVTSASGTGVPA
jgi:hypothetical protein